MKIGILTYHRSMNYGAVMQSAALAEALATRFPNTSVEIVDYCSKKMERYYRMITVYRGKEGVAHFLKRVEMFFAFQKGIKQLPLSKERLSSDNIEIFDKWIADRYDILITGSDAVWNYKKRGLPNPYFLSNSSKAVRFSYAASCNGLGIQSFDDITIEQRAYLKDSFEKFAFIGVRDIQTERLVHAVSPDLKVKHNCDPSILLGDLSNRDRALLIEKLKKKYGFNPNKPTIAFMMSNLNGAFRKDIGLRIKEKYGNRYQTVSLYSYNKYADVPYIADLTPQEWSIIFGLFDLTISKYFHGTMFSLLNHTPVIAVGAESTIEGLPDKIEDALERMELQDYYFGTKHAQTIDWDALMEKIDECLTVDQTERIVRGIEREKATSEVFFTELKHVIDTIE